MKAVCDFKNDTIQCQKLLTSPKELINISPHQRNQILLNVTGQWGLLTDKDNSAIDQIRDPPYEFVKCPWR